MRNDPWGISIPGLTRERAEEIRDLLLPASPFGVVLLDPKTFIIDGFDRSTVEVMIKCMEAGLASGNLSQHESNGVESLLDDYRDWLDHSSSGE